MKIERLIGILFYILNRNCVSATTLAKHFGVSRRTILRDIDTLTLAGIPLYSEIGSKGGYSIARDYKLSEKLIDTANSEYMLLALKSLKDIYGDKKVTETYEKVKHIFPSSINENAMGIDLSVINENKYVIDTVFELKKAVQQKSNISFDYTNSKSKSMQIRLDVLHVFYKWYSWYVFGYNCDTNMFRMYKVVRMKNLKISTDKWKQEYDIEKQLEEYEKKREKNNITVQLQYQKEIQSLVEEYFPSKSSIESNNTIISELEMKEDDFVLFSILIGFGDKIKVLSPLSFSQKIQDHLKSTLEIYQEQ